MGLTSIFPFSFKTLNVLNQMSCQTLSLLPLELSIFISVHLIKSKHNGILRRKTLLPVGTGSWNAGSLYLPGEKSLLNPQGPISSVTAFTNLFLSSIHSGAVHPVAPAITVLIWSMVTLWITKQAQLWTPNKIVWKVGTALPKRGLFWIPN